MEEAVSRGRVWFWMYVARTTLPLWWRKFTEASLRMKWGAFLPMSMLLPFHGAFSPFCGHFHQRKSLPMVAVTQAFVLFGVLWERPRDILHS